MNQPDPMIDESVLRALAGSAISVSLREIAQISGVHEGQVWESARRLVAAGLAEERQAGHQYVATPEGQRRGSTAIVASIDAEMQSLFAEERNAIVAAAVEVMDEANREKILALLSRSSAPLSRDLLATTIGEDRETVEDLAAALIADGLIEPRMNGNSYAATDKGRKAAADITDAEMQDLFSSDRDAIVASTAALMSLDLADFQAAAAEQSKADARMLASLDRKSHELGLLRARRDARQAVAQWCRTKSAADSARILEASREVRARMVALGLKKPKQGRS